MVPEVVVHALPGKASVHVCTCSNSACGVGCCSEVLGARWYLLVGRLCSLLLGARWYPTLCDVGTFVSVLVLGSTVGPVCVMGNRLRVSFGCAPALRRPMCSRLPACIEYLQLLGGRWVITSDGKCPVGDCGERCWLGEQCEPDSNRGWWLLGFCLCTLRFAIRVREGCETRTAWVLCAVGRLVGWVRGRVGRARMGAGPVRRDLYVLRFGWTALSSLNAQCKCLRPSL
jgi:hypothetical protein